jgi:hypothetical protein
MHCIQPCCAKRNLLHLRNAIKNNGTAYFEGYGDMSLTELLPALLTRYDNVEMMIVAPTLPDQAAEIISTWMRKQYAAKDGLGKIDVIHHLTIIADLSMEKSPMASMWAKVKPFGARLEIRDVKQEETAILLPDFAIIGPVNMRYGHHFIATATTEPGRVKELWKKYSSLTEQPAPASEEVPVTEEQPAAEPEKKPKRAKKNAKRNKKKVAQ